MKGAYNCKQEMTRHIEIRKQQKVIRDQSINIINDIKFKQQQ